MSSILTNNSAMVALQTLKSINGDLAKTQSMISTGKSVAILNFLKMDILPVFL